MTDIPTKRPATDDTTHVLGVRIQGPLERSQRLSWLEQREGPGAPQDHVLEALETIVGRSPDASWVIESPLISRRHLLFVRNGSEITCRDLDSSNGVYLNGIKIHAALLHTGDTLQMGDVVLLFHEGQ